MKPTLCALISVLTVCLNSACGQTWTLSTNAPFAQWWSVASSADGTRLIAAVNGRGIYTSTNSGLTWNSNSVPVSQWDSVASSSDGSKLFAASETLSLSGTNAGIWKSTNGGANWFQTKARASVFAWYSIACSTNSTKLVAAGAQSASLVYTSSDQGNTWTITTVPSIGNAAVGYSVASSGDGSILAVSAYEGNAVFTSTDSGVNWTSNYISDATCQAIALASDGSRLFVGSEGNMADGHIYASTNLGTSWITEKAPPLEWQSLALSLDGQRIVGCGYGINLTAIYTSSDGGSSWVSNNVPTNCVWQSVASSSDGSKLVAAARNGYLCTGVEITPLLNLSVSGSTLVLSWLSAGYQLEQSSNLAAASWMPVTNTVSVTNGQNQVMISTTNGPSFYRLKSQ